MNLDRFNGICANLPHTTTVVQWGGSHVWKIGDKVFAIGSPRGEAGDTPCPVSLKTDELAFEMLTHEVGVARHSHLHRGNWLTFQPDCPVDDDSVESYISRSYEIIRAGLTKSKRAELAAG